MIEARAGNEAVETFIEGGTRGAMRGIVTTGFPD
jgi:hypothetical protein